MFTDHGEKRLFDDAAERPAVQPRAERPLAVGLDDAVQEQAHRSASVAVAATISAISSSIRLTSATASVT